MVSIEDCRRICKLIAKQLSCALASDEEEELQQWLAESVENRQLYEKITDRDYWGGQEKKRDSIDVRNHWLQVERALGRRTYRYFLWKYGRYAAIVLFLLGIGLAGWLSRPESAEILVQAEQIQPGAPKAFLILADGKSVELGGVDEEKQQFTCDGAVITSRSGNLTYNADESVPASMDRHALVIPKGGEYVMTLGDGTLVYLNSESKIEYPVRFDEKNREVYLEGEAYFKVAHCENRSFTVRTGNMDIKVSGTDFNVKAYADEHRVQTTLVQGEVTVFTGIDRTVSNRLKPAQQADLDLDKGRLEVRSVDVAPFIAWKNGQFLFKGERLDEIMTVLKRWYDFEVVYQEEWIKEIEFAGKLNRSDSFEPILDVIRSTHKLNVDVKGKTILFSVK